PLPLVLLAHTRPDVGVDHVRPSSRLARVAHRLDPRRVVAMRRGGDELHPERGADLGERGADVVAVPDVRDAHAVEAAEPPPDRPRVRERLARVSLVGEAVHDGYVSVLGELVDRPLGEGPDHDRVEVAGQHDPDVPGRLALAEADLRSGQMDGVAAELLDGELEGDACSERRLLEHEPDAPPGEEWLVDVALAL